MARPNMIGLSGYARSGKDTVADFLVSDHGFTKVSFAQPMRDALYALNPLVGAGWRVQNVIDTYGWDYYKETDFGDEIRGLMQRLGTDVARKQWYDGFWVDIAIEKATDLLDEGKKVVFTDVRFPNEAEMIEYYNGEVWRVRRPGIFPANDHVSETGMDDYAFAKHIDNNGTLEQLSWVVAEHAG